MARGGKSLLRAVPLQTPEFEANEQVDKVAELTPEPPVIVQEVLDGITAIFGPQIADDHAKITAIITAQRAMGEETSRMVQAAVNMGRYLLDVRRVLSHDEFEHALKHSAELWSGWSRPNVVKLMKIAEWWDRQQFPQALAPRHYTILYEFAVLEPPVLSRAIDEGVFRPDVTRNEVSGWKRQIGNTPAAPLAVLPAGEATVLEARRHLMRLRERERLLVTELESNRRQQSVWENVLTSSSQSH